MADRKPKRGDDRSRNWRDWSRGIENDRFDGDLSEVGSEVHDFGNTAKEGFAEAWSKPVQSGSDAHLDAITGPDTAPSGDSDSGESLQSRFDQRWSPSAVIGAMILVALVVVGVIFAIRTPDRTESEADETAAQFESEFELSAPGEQRDYGDGPATLETSASTPIEQGFSSAAGEDPEPTAQRQAGLPTNASFSLAFWGGRTHVAVVGDGLDLPGNCVVVSLFSADFAVVDVAASGDCGSRYSATGDRTACRSEDAVMIEVWPENPSSIVPTPTPSQLRVRIEQVQSDGRAASVRSTQMLDQRVQALSEPVNGAPGTTADFIFGERRGGCELLDRSGVQVRFL